MVYVINFHINFYKDWCDERGYLYVPPQDDTSTVELMKESDCVILNGSSAGLEAGFLGIPVVLISPAASGCLPVASAAAEVILPIPFAAPVTIAVFPLIEKDIIYFPLKFWF